jgi:hypothetical protein
MFDRLDVTKIITPLPAAMHKPGYSPASQSGVLRRKRGGPWPLATGAAEALLRLPK